MRDKTHDSYFEALSLEEFQNLAFENQLVPVYKEIPADLVTTTVLYEKLSAAFSGGSFILESIGRLNDPQKAETIWWGRYTYLGFDPMVIYRGGASQIDITSGGQTRQIETSQPHEFLRDEMQKYAGVRAQYMPALWGGMVGYEGFPTSSRSSDSLPDFAFMIPGVLIGIEHKRSRMQIITFAQITDETQLQQQYDDANARLDRVIDIIQQPHDDSQRGLLDAQPARSLSIDSGDLDALRAAAQSEFEKQQLHYLKLLKVVDVEASIGAHSLYRALRANAPSNNMFYLDFGDFVVMGASPEVLFRVEDGELHSRPLVYAARDADSDEVRTGAYLDRANEYILAARSEAVQPFIDGTPETAITPDSEKSRLLNQAEVIGTAIENIDAFSLLSALNPSETGYGIPGQAALDTVRRIEQPSRGIFGGCAGFVGFDGNAEMCTLVESFVVKDSHIQYALPLHIGLDSDDDRASVRMHQEKLLHLLDEAMQVYG